MNSEFKFCPQLFKEIDENGSMTWTVSKNLIERNDYYNKCSLNSMLKNLIKLFYKGELYYKGWKTPCMCIKGPPHWIKDFNSFVIFALSR